MRGTKGGFWDRLIERIKYFIKRKKKKKLEQKQEEISKKKRKEKIKKDEEILNSVQYIQKMNLNYKVINIKKIDKKFKNRIVYKNNIKNNNIFNTKKESTPKNKVINSILINKKEKEKLLQNNKRINYINIKNSINNNNILKDEKIINIIKNIIIKDKEELNKVIEQVKNIQKEIEQEKNIEKINKYEEKLKELENKIRKIINTYETLKNKLSSDILIKLENEGLIKVVGDPKNLSDEDLEYIINTYQTNLDYYEKLISVKTLIDDSKEKASNRKIVVIELKNELNEENKQLNNIINESKKLFEQYKLENKKISEIENKINNIKINKTIIKYNSANNIINRTGQFIKGVLGVPLVASMNPALIAVGSYLIGTSISNMRKKVDNKQITKIYYEPDITYIEELRKNKYTIDDLLKMINNNITDIKYFKEEYISNFGNYHNYSDYMENMRKINDVEKTLIKQKKLIEKQKQKLKQVENQQQKKLIYIKSLNDESRKNN